MQQQRATHRLKRNYDSKAVARAFPIGCWTLRYYPPARKNKLCSPWIRPYKIVRAPMEWVVGIQIDADARTRSLEHQLCLLSVRIPRGWIQRRLYRSIIYRKTVVLESISRQYRPCTPREFHRTLSLGRPQRISYGISFEKDRSMCVQPQCKRKTVH